METTFESFNNLGNDMLKHFVKDGEIVETITNSDEFKKVLDKTNKIIFDKYLIIADKSNENKPTCMIVRDAPRSRGIYKWKIVSNYRFKSVERMIAHTKEFIDNINSRYDYKEKQKQQRKIDNEKARGSLKVGDLMYDSWGYDQTNVDFYQVTKVKGASVWLRPIAGESVDGSQGNMSDNVKPVKDRFIGEEFRKVIKGMGDNIYLSGRFGSISLYTNGDKGTYRSWYA